jgi:deoxyribonuclease-4
MLIIGCHLSSSKGYAAMGKQARSIGANTFQFFTRNPRGSKAKAIDEKDVKAYLEYAKMNGIEVILAHAPYTLNPASGDSSIREFAFMTMEDDLRRMEYTPGNLYNFHPGSHVGQGVETGVENIAAILNQLLKPEQTTLVLLETMAGKGSEVGSKFCELKAIIDKVELKDKVGICLDTCHIYDAGYDIVNNLEGVLAEFDELIGLDKLKAIHLNDSKNPFESHKDRHEKIGEGSIGIKTMEAIINHPKLRHLPFFLETPNEIEGYEQEIKVLRDLYQ